MCEDRTDGETAAERDGVWGSQRRASSMASMIFCFRGESGLEPDADGSTRPVEVPGWPRRDVGAVSNTDRLVGEVEIMLDGRPRYIWRFFGVWASSEGESDASSRVRFPRVVGVRGGAAAAGSGVDGRSVLGGSRDGGMTIVSSVSPSSNPAMSCVKSASE